MLYKAEATVFSEFNLKHKNIICGYNVDFLNVKTFTACSNIDFKRLICPQSNFLYMTVFLLSVTPLSIF